MYELWYRRYSAKIIWKKNSLSACYPKISVQVFCLYAPPNNMNRKNRLTHSELNILIDCARGLSAYEIASLRHMGYKTVFTHKQNIRLRLSLQKVSQLAGSA
jgi:DNA-binding CsgD family transcriptional regulator